MRYALLGLAAALLLAVFGTSARSDQLRDVRDGDKIYTQIFCSSLNDAVAATSAARKSELTETQKNELVARVVERCAVGPLYRLAVTVHHVVSGPYIDEAGDKFFVVTVKLGDRIVYSLVWSFNLVGEEA